MVFINNANEICIRYTNLHYCSTCSHMNFDFYSAIEINPSNRKRLKKT